MLRVAVLLRYSEACATISVLGCIKALRHSASWFESIEQTWFDSSKSNDRWLNFFNQHKILEKKSRPSFIHGSKKFCFIDIPF